MLAGAAAWLLATPIPGTFPLVQVPAGTNFWRFHMPWRGGGRIVGRNAVEAFRCVIAGKGNWSVNYTARARLQPLEACFILTNAARLGVTMSDPRPGIATSRNSPWSLMLRRGRH